MNTCFKTKWGAKQIYIALGNTHYQYLDFVLVIYINPCFLKEFIYKVFFYDEFDLGTSPLIKLIPFPKNESGIR